MTEDGQKFVEGVRTLLPNPEDDDLIVKIFTASGLLEDPDWGNVPLHCLTVAQVCDFLCRLLNLTDHDRKLAVMAALLHDVGKKNEKLLRQSIAAEGGSDDFAVRVAARFQAAWLGQFKGITEAVRVSGLSGHTSLVYFLVRERPVVEMIFHLADDLCGDKEVGARRGDTVLMLDERVDQLGVYYQFLVDEGLEGESWIAIQERVSAQFLDELAALTGFDSGLLLNAWLVEQQASNG